MSYQDLPTAQIKDLAEAGDTDACLELSRRYEIGTALLPKDSAQSMYWKNRAEKILSGECLLDISYANFKQLNIEEKFEEALKVLEERRSNNLLVDDLFYHLMKGRLLCKISCSTGNLDENCFKEIKKELCKALETADKDNSYYCNYWLARAYQQFGYYYDARKYYILALNVPDEYVQDDSKERLSEIEEKELAETWRNYVNTYEYKDRKFIMPINDNEIAECVVDGIETFRISNIPSCIKFPMGHPVANELYIGHPYNPSLYVPYIQSEEIFFLDKIHELAYLLESLGAEEITMTSIKGRNVSEYANSDRGITGDVNAGAVNTEANIRTAKSTEQTSTSNASRTLTMKFDPMKKPFLPDGLIWYGEQPQWQRLVNSRLNGNLLEYNEFVSSATTKFVSESEKMGVKASANYLWNKIGGGVERNTESQFKESVETQWKVEVKFRSVKEFTEEGTLINVSAKSKLYTSQEQEYLDNLKEFLEDDAKITPRERKMLDRIRLSLGLSEERAQELEASLKPQFTDDEQDYLDMYREYKEKGDITEKERRRLDKFASALGISEGRTKEIEQI